MWIWCLLSLVILIACAVLTYRLFITSDDFLPDDKKSFMFFNKKPANKNTTDDQDEVVRKLKNKLASLEDTTSFYEIQFSKLQQRLSVLELQSGNSGGMKTTPGKEDEDWQEMYFEENEKKEKLENELDQTRQYLEEIESKLNTIEESNSQLASLKSENDARLNDIQSMQNTIGLLQRQLEGAAKRENELEDILLSEITIKKKYDQMESNYVLLQSDNDDLKRQVVKMTHRERELEFRVIELNELKSRLAIYEEEKSRMLAHLELMSNQNNLFSPENNS